MTVPIRVGVALPSCRRDGRVVPCVVPMGGGINGATSIAPIYLWPATHNTQHTPHTHTRSNVTGFSTPTRSCRCVVVTYTSGWMNLCKMQAHAISNQPRAFDWRVGWLEEVVRAAAQTGWCRVKVRRSCFSVCWFHNFCARIRFLTVLNKRTTVSPTPHIVH